MADGSDVRVTDEGALHKYRTEIPNTVIKGMKSRELSLQAKWLYVYLKSVAGEGRECWQSTATLVQGSGMGRGSISRAKQELLTHGLIKVTKGTRTNKDSDHISMVDIWQANMIEFSGVPIGNSGAHHEDTVKTAPHDSSVPRGNSTNSSVPGGNSGVPGGDQRRSLLRRSHEEEEEDLLPSVGDFGDAEILTSPSLTNGPVVAAPVKTKKAIKRNKWLDRGAWEATDQGEFFDLIIAQEHLWKDPAFVLNGPWWKAKDDQYGSWLTVERMRIEFAKMTGWVLTEGNHPPTSAGGWKTFITNWLKGAYSDYRREEARLRRQNHAPQH